MPKISSENESNILHIIRTYNAISVKEIVKLSGLSIPGAMNYITPMLKSGLLVETVRKDTLVGRKPRQLSIASNYRHVVGIDLGTETAGIVAANLNGDVICKEFIDLRKFSTGEGKITAVVNGTHVMLQNAGIPESLVSEIVIGNPGVVDPQTGKISMQANFANWHELPLKQIFEREFANFVEVFNDVNLATIGEKEFGAGKGHSNFVYIRDDVGLKAGIILNGNLFEGASNAAGEFGRGSLIQSINFADISDKLVCIEDAVTMTALLEDIKAALPEYADDILFWLCGMHPENLTMENIRQALDGNSPCAMKIVKEKARLLAFSVVNLALILDIRLIIFGGEIEKLGEYFLLIMRDILDLTISIPLTVQYSDLGSHACLKGAIYVALNGTFSRFCKE
jgi:predicted NBD/HSP70 family sugar kinase